MNSRNTVPLVIILLWVVGVAAPALGQQDLRVAEAVDRGDASKLEEALKAGAPVDASTDGLLTPLQMTLSGEPRPDLAEILLRHGADPNVTEPMLRYTPLLEASYKNLPGLVSALLQAKAEPNYRAPSQATALSLAATKGHAEVLRVLLEGGADPNLADKFGITPLHLACQFGTADCVKLLVNHKADVNAANQDGLVPLYGAILFDKADAVRILLAAGANPRVKDKHGTSLLEHAKTLKATKCEALLKAEM